LKRNFAHDSSMHNVDVLPPVHTLQYFGPYRITEPSQMSLPKQKYEVA
jgi:hypothetical protein